MGPARSTTPWMNWTRPSGTSGRPFSIAAHPVHHASLTKTHDGPPCTPTLARAVPMNSRQRRGSSHAWGADGVSCSVLPEGLDAGDREPGELSRAGLLRRAGPPNGHARRGRHRAEVPLLLWVPVLPDARSAARRRAFHRAGRLPSRWPSAPPRTPGRPPRVAVQLPLRPRAAAALNVTVGARVVAPGPEGCHRSQVGCASRFPENPQAICSCPRGLELPIPGEHRKAHKGI